MLVEPPPASSFVVIQSQLILELLEIPLDAPPDLRQRNEFFEFHVLGYVREPVLRRLFFLGRPFDQEPFERMDLASKLVPMGRVHPYGREA